jgi:hypothetical protein
MTRVAIMQPTYLPWMGYFDLIDQVDRFVLLDTVQFDKRSWQCRNRIRTAKSELEWLTVPAIVSGRRHQAIRDVEFADPRFLQRHVTSIRHAYTSAPFFAALVDQLEEVLRRGADSRHLSALNEAIIVWLAGLLGIATPIVRASNLHIDGRRSDLLAMICQRLGATRYLSPPGSVGYLADERGAFEKRGIAIEIQCFEHPVYQQNRPGFVSHASILDALFNLGPEETARSLRSGRREAVTLDAWLAAHPLPLPEEVP